MENDILKTHDYHLNSYFLLNMTYNIKDKI